jgi:opacity protein-like surface antigen
MRKFLLGTVALLALVALVGVGAATAADDTLYSKPAASSTTVTNNNLPSPALPKPSPSPSTYSWSGWYGGVNVGWGIGRADSTVNPLPSAATFVNLLPTDFSPNPGGPLGGGQFGYQCQRGHVVFGAETDFDWTGMNGTSFMTRSFRTTVLRSRAVALSPSIRTPNGWVQFAASLASFLAHASRFTARVAMPMRASTILQTQISCRSEPNNIQPTSVR